MLYALDHPFSLLVLLVSFVVCVTLIGWITSYAAFRQGQRGLRPQGRTRPDPRRQVDPFGAISGLIAGFGWGLPVDVPRKSAPQVAVVVLLGPLVVLGIGLGALAAFGAHYGGDIGPFLNQVGGANLLQQGAEGLSTGQESWLLGGLMATYVGALSLVPLPPLPGGQVLFAAAPRTIGWQKAEYQLVERNIGTAVLLALMLIPLSSNQALLPHVLDDLLGPLMELVTGG